MAWPPTSLTATQQANANTIMAVGHAVGATSRDIQIALMTAMQESELLNMNSGDRDSLGIFQQRAAWAPAAARMDVAQSALMFFKGGQNGQPGLFSFKNRDSMSLTQAAQAVQVSAYPDAYAKWASLATTAMGAGPQPMTGLSEHASIPAAPAAAVQGAGIVAAPSATAGISAATSSDGGAPAGVAAATSTPGATAADASVSVGSVADPAAITGPPAPSGPLDAASFHSMFPDAAATKMFSAPAQRAGASLRSSVVAAAMSYLGTPYVWGGNGRQGVDCSGLIQQSLKAIGVDMPRVSSDQINSGVRIATSKLQPGDMIGWDENSRNVGADHIAFYIGNNQIIEAPRPGLAVRIRTLTPAEMKSGMGVTLAQYG